MIFLINKQLQQELALEVCDKSDDGLVSLFDRNRDRYFIVDDYLALSRFLDYASLDYRLVTNIPGSNVDGELVAPREKIISYDNFLKENQASRSKSDAKSELENELLENADESEVEYDYE